MREKWEKEKLTKDLESKKRLIKMNLGKESNFKGTEREKSIISREKTSKEQTLMMLSN